MNECTLLFMVISFRLKLNLDERFSLTKRDKLRMKNKKKEEKKEVDRQKTLQIEPVV